MFYGKTNGTVILYSLVNYCGEKSGSLQPFHPPANALSIVETRKPNTTFPDALSAKVAAIYRKQ